MTRVTWPNPRTAEPAHREATPDASLDTRVLIVRTLLTPAHPGEVVWRADEALADTAPKGTIIVAQGQHEAVNERYRELLARMGAPVVNGPAVLYWRDEHEEDVQDEEGRVTGTRTVPAHWAALRLTRWPIAERTWQAVEAAIAEARGEENKGR